jgi:DNA invertase Pin-like site-specific DNA recombinase
MDMAVGMKVVRYVRVSAEERAHTGVSLATQKQKIRAWADAMDAELISIQEDAGISGKLMRNREGIQTAI